MTTVPTSFFKHRGVTVQVSKLSKQYKMGPEQVHALRDTDWRVDTGTAVAIMGPSGCGKTTLLNLLGGVDRPSGGKITIDNDDLTAMNERSLEKHRLLNVGFVFQFFNLIPSITAIENLELPMVMAGVPEAQCRERAHTLLGMVGLDAKGQKRPRSSQAVNSSGSPSRWLWPTTRHSFWRMNPPVIWTASTRPQSPSCSPAWPPITGRR